MIFGFIEKIILVLMYIYANKNLNYKKFQSNYYNNEVRLLNIFLLLVKNRLQQKSFILMRVI